MAVSNYLYDVFISYRRSDTGAFWVSKYFKPRLEEELQHYLGRKVKIFLDDKEIPIGAQWPQRIKEALATSRCIVPVFCGLYFNSIWCTREFAVFLNRERKSNHGRKDHLFEIILPVIVRDGDHLPPLTKDIKRLGLENYFTSCESFRSSPDFRDFEKEIMKFARDISVSIKERTPEWKQQWFARKWLESVSIDELYNPDETNIYDNPTLK